jgi:hypothetical protein
MDETRSGRIRPALIIARARLPWLRGLQAAVGMVADTVTEAATQLEFLMSGAALLLMGSSDRGAAVATSAAPAGAGVFLVAPAANDPR